MTFTIIECSVDDERASSFISTSFDIRFARPIKSSVIANRLSMQIFVV